jgi:hypothetical protein
MRELTAGQEEFQRRTMLVEASQTISRDVSGPAVTDAMARWSIPTNWLEIQLVRDYNGDRMLVVGWQTFRDIIERANSGILGYHETPLYFGHIREREGAAVREWEKFNGKGIPRICAFWNELMYRYPADPLDTTFSIDYIPNLDIFSEASAQWATWFPVSAFEGQFASTGPDNQIRRYEKAFVHYAVAEFVKDKNVLTGQEPAFQHHRNAFEQLVAEALEMKPTMSHELQAPYYGLQLPIR